MITFKKTRTAWYLLLIGVSSCLAVVQGFQPMSAVMRGTTTSTSTRRGRMGQQDMQRSSSSSSSSTLDQSRTSRMLGPSCFLLSAAASSGNHEVSEQQKQEEATATATATATTRMTTMNSFTTPPMKVYIEDTDAYGIMYNSNYLRSFDRALHMMTTPYNTHRRDHQHQQHQDNLRDPDVDRETAGIRISGRHEGWSIVSMGQQRFGASPRLGQVFIIEGTLQRMNADDSKEVWDMEMKSLDGTTVYNWVKDVTIQVAEHPHDSSSSSSDELVQQNQALHSSLEDIPPFDIDTIQPNFMCKEDYFTVYRDEIDAHWQGHLPLRNVLNLFERSRTNALGGPEGLRRLQEDEDNAVIVVVTGVSDLTLVDEGVLLIPGQVVAVETAMVVKRRGMVVECYQTLRRTTTRSRASDQNAETQTSSMARLAQGKVTLMMLDAKTRRPTTRLPGWARELLQVEATVQQ